MNGLLVNWLIFQSIGDFWMQVLASSVIGKTARTYVMSPRTMRRTMVAEMESVDM
jgi:hypothetical protein